MRRVTLENKEPGKSVVSHETGGAYAEHEGDKLKFGETLQ